MTTPEPPGPDGAHGHRVPGGRGRTRAAQAITAGEIDGVLHYSRRSADAFLRWADAAGLRERALALTHFCLSPQVSAPLAQAGAADIRIATRPEGVALLDLVGSA